MLLKLIQGGGFAGKSKIAEEDLSAYPPEICQKLEEYLDKHPSANVSTATIGRDVFQYNLEYKDKRIQIQEDQDLDPELKQLIDKLKEKLH